MRTCVFFFFLREKTGIGVFLGLLGLRFVLSGFFGVLGFGGWGLGFGVLGFGVWGLGFGVGGLGFGEIGRACCRDRWENSVSTVSVKKIIRWKTRCVPNECRAHWSE